MTEGAPPTGAGSSISFSCPEEVSKRVAQLYGDERLADVVFLVRQGDDGPEKRFVAHRNLVAAWSRPLDRMLCGDFAEGSSREVRIRDVEPAAFEAMLKLMYCGVAEITGDNVLAVLDVSVRFDVAPLVHFSVQFLQNHTSSEHACRMLEVGVQYGLSRLVDKCIELIVTDDHILESEDFCGLSQAAVVELAKHDSWNLHEDEIYDTMMRWAAANSSKEEDKRRLSGPILEHLRYPHMSIEKLKLLSTTNEVPSRLLFEALFFLLRPGEAPAAQPAGRFRPRPGSLLFSWAPTAKVTVSGEHGENARHTSSSGFTGVRGDRRMQHGVYSWTIDVAETQSSWIFVGVAQADDTNDVAWRSSGRMLYCLDSRVFHQGSGSNHPCGDRKVCSGDCLRVVLDCTRQTLAFGINNEKPLVLFRDLAPVAYVPAVDLRDCGDKVRILSSSRHVRGSPGEAPRRQPSPEGQRPPAPAPAAPEAEVPVLQQPTPGLNGRTEPPAGLPETAPPAAVAIAVPPEAPVVAEPAVGRASAAAAPMLPPSAAAAPPEPWAAAPTPPAARRPAGAGAGEVHSTGLPHASHPVHTPHGGSIGGSQGSHPHAAASGSAVRTSPRAAFLGLQPRQSQGSQGGVPPAPAANVADREDEPPHPPPPPADA